MRPEIVHFIFQKDNKLKIGGKAPFAKQASKNKINKVNVEN